MTKIGRNDLCFCGSGKKYKQCHLQTASSTEFLLNYPPVRVDCPRHVGEVRRIPSKLETTANIDLETEYSE